MSTIPALEQLNDGVVVGHRQRRTTASPVQAGPETLHQRGRLREDFGGDGLVRENVQVLAIGRELEAKRAAQRLETLDRVKGDVLAVAQSVIPPIFKRRRRLGNNRGAENEARG